MALPKTFGLEPEKRDENQLPPLPESSDSIYGEAPQAAPEPELPAIEDDSFTTIPPSDASFYDEKDLAGAMHGPAPSSPQVPSQSLNQPDVQTPSPATIKENPPLRSYEHASVSQQVYPEKIDEKSQKIIELYPDTVEAVQALHDSVNSSFVLRDQEYDVEEVSEAIAQHKEEDSEETVFVDKKGKKLKPFGKGSKKNRAPKGAKHDLKTHEFDSRKNIRNRSKITMIAFLVASLVLIGLAGYKVFLGRDSLTVEEVVNIAMNTAGDTGFPLEAGQAVAENFIEAYLTTNDSTSSSILNMYYGDSSGSNRNILGTDYTQRILTGPLTFEAEAISSYSAAYTLGALVTMELPKLTEEQIANKEGDARPTPEAEWIFFVVNVYYDEENGSFTIPPNSPSIVPSVSINPSASAPNQLSPGTGEVTEEFDDIVNALLEQFFEAYAKSSPSDWERLTPYIVNPVPVELRDGLNGQYTLNPGSISSTVYLTNEVPDAPSDVLKAVVQLEWIFSPVGEDSIDEYGGLVFTSYYVVTLERGTDNSYKINKLAPIYYLKAD